MKVGFLVNDLQLSGGIGVVVHHARQLRSHHDIDARLVLVREQDDPHWAHHALEGIPVEDLTQARTEPWNIAVATWWQTTFALFELDARRYTMFVQSLEDRFYGIDEPERLIAGLVLDLPVTFITEARWIRDTLAQLRPDAHCHLVRNGVDKAIFAGPEKIAPRLREPLRVLVEGNPSSWFKFVPSAISATAAMTEPHHLTVVSAEREGLPDASIDRLVGPVDQREMAALYADSDVVLKLSSVEGMYGPPLEGFHMGATCVTTEVTGHEEYVVHGHNGLLVDWDDQRGTARALDLLARDRRLLTELRHNALHTARGWPDWRQAGTFMAAALQAIARAEPPSTRAAAASLTTGLRGAMEVHQAHLPELRRLRRRSERVDKLLALPGLPKLLGARHRPPVSTVLGLARRVLGR